MKMQCLTYYSRFTGSHIKIICRTLSLSSKLSSTGDEFVVNKLDGDLKGNYA